MLQTLELNNLGPIGQCRLEINRFTVFTGPQSNGKSTVAKAVYFFKSVKQDILNIMMRGGPGAMSDRGRETWMRVLKQRMRDKFLQLFGTSWIMPDDMEMRYAYTQSVWLRVFLVPGQTDAGNFIEFEFSNSFRDYLEDLDSHVFRNITAKEMAREKTALERKLSDPYETVFIPAGRNLITLLSTQLNYIFTSLEGVQLRNIDHITRRYTELILKLKPLFSEGMNGILAGLENDIDQFKRYKKHRAAIRILMERAEDMLKGVYRCVDGEERLYLDNRRYIKINFASSGQQEIVWVINLMFYYLVEDRRVFMILEEPESHLYPDSQQTLGEVLALFLNEGNGGLITTHSPYLLGTFNYLLLAGQTSREKQEKIKAKLHKRYWIDPDIASACYIHDGRMENAIDSDDDLRLINNELIDGVSGSINALSEYIIEQSYEGEAEDE